MKFNILIKTPRHVEAHYGITAGEAERVHPQKGFGWIQRLVHAAEQDQQALELDVKIGKTRVEIESYRENS